MVLKMAKSQKKIGKCESCGNTLIVDLDEEFYCNTWGCFVIHQNPDKERRNKEFRIVGEDRLVNGIYQPKEDE